MKIECILKRQGGTVVDLGGKTYHFKPQDDGAHVAEVADDEHVEKLLAVSEAYQPYGGDFQLDADGDIDTQPQATAPKTRKKATPAPTEATPPTDEQGE